MGSRYFSIIPGHFSTDKRSAINFTKFYYDFKHLIKFLKISLVDMVINEDKIRI